MGVDFDRPSRRCVGSLGQTVLVADTDSCGSWEQPACAAAPIDCAAAAASRDGCCNGTSEDQTYSVQPEDEVYSIRPRRVKVKNIFADLYGLLYTNFFKNLSRKIL
jgi:hypothetical protein